MWHPPGPGIEPVSPALAGRFFTTEPPGKPLPPSLPLSFFLLSVLVVCCLQDSSLTRAWTQAVTVRACILTTRPPGKSPGLLSSSAVKVKVTQPSLTACNPMDYTVRGLLQARILEWVAFPSSRGSSQPRDRTQVSWIAGEFFTIWTTMKAQRSVLCFRSATQAKTVLLFLMLQTKIPDLYLIGQTGSRAYPHPIMLVRAVALMMGPGFQF